MVDIENLERNLVFNPPIPKGTAIQLDFMMDGRARVTVRCITSGHVMQVRPDCEIIEVDGKQVCVALPGSIKTIKISWKVKLLRWLAKG